MKTRILLLGVLTALSVQTSRSASTAGVTILQTYPGMPRLDNSKLPWLDYSKLPWLKQPAPAQVESGASMDGLLANLKTDIESAASGLTALTDGLKTDQQNTIVTGPATPLAVDDSTLLSRDFSTLLSQDLSVNYGQLLSTSLAVPTSLPTPPWVNRPGAVAVQTPSGEAVIPTYPPRTAWGNGGGIVTTPGGAVFSVVPGGAKGLADSEALRNLSHQLAVMQNDVERLESFLKKINARTTVPGITLGPARSDNAKPGDQNSPTRRSDGLDLHE